MSRPTLVTALAFPLATRWLFAGAVMVTGVTITEVQAQDGRNNGYVQQRFDRERFQLNRFQEDARSITQPQRLMPSLVEQRQRRRYAGTDWSLQFGNPGAQQGPSDVRRKPRSYQRQTHRGWEVQTNNYEIVAPNKEKAEAAAQEFERGWATALRLADRVGRNTKESGFALRSVVLFVDGDQKELPRSNREFANQSQYVIQLRSGEDSALHAHEIRAAACRSFLSASEWDRELPPWFVLGLSEWVAARFDETPRSFTTETPDAGETLVGTNGPFRSVRQIAPAAPAPRHDDAAVVSFLLEENGGQNAWIALDALRDRAQAKERLNVIRDESQAAFRPETLLRLEPQIQFSAPEENDGEVLAAERDLYVLLRLAERERRHGFQSSLGTVSGIRVVEFQNGQTQEQDVRINQGEVANKRATELQAMLKRRLRSKLSENNWSVISPAGDWIDRSNSYAISQRLSSDLTIEFDDDRWQVSYELPGNSARQLTAVWRQPSSPGSTIQFGDPRTLEKPGSSTKIVTPPSGS